MKSGQEVIGRIENFPFKMPVLTYEVGDARAWAIPFVAQ